jgi:hypothetical protein
VAVRLYPAGCVAGKFFDPFLFEEMPVADLTVQEAYLTEVEHCDIYIGILGALRRVFEYEVNGTLQGTCTVRLQIRTDQAVLPIEIKR